MSLAEEVITAFGGAVKLARAVGWPTSTVDTWKRTGTIPPWRRPFIIAAAKRNGVTLPAAFVEEEGVRHTPPTSPAPPKMTAPPRGGFFRRLKSVLRGAS